MGNDNPHPLWRNGCTTVFPGVPGEWVPVECADRVIAELEKDKEELRKALALARTWVALRIGPTHPDMQIIDAAMNQTAQSAPVDLEDAPRIECQFCGSDYNVMWKGTTCSVCGGIIGETAQSEVKPK